MTSGDRVADWVALLHDLYPVGDAEGWDSVGLQVGDPDDAVGTVLVCLDITSAVLDEAAGAGADLLVAHHPLLLRPLERLTPGTARGRLALRAARERRAVVAAHTNFDVAAPGTTEPMTDLLGLVDVRPLRPSPDDELQQVKLVTFVPEADTAAVLAALSGAGAGRIGAYDHCSFRSRGTGTFRPSAAANPTVGERGTLNEVAEDRLEIVVGVDRLEEAVAALRRAHPYEEVAFDAYPLMSPGRDGAKGLGRVGDLPAPLPLHQVADRLAEGLPSPHLRVVGDLQRPVQRVAACGGAGDGLISDAVRADADVYVTGDLRHHAALDAATLGLALIDAGHYATEAAALPTLRTSLAEAARDRGLTAGLLASEVRTEPWADYPPAPRG